MKTPMQELIFVIRKRQEDEDVQPFMWLEQIVELAESMLKKEREIICNAFSDARHGAVESRWTAEEYFEEIFNNKDNG